MGLPEARGWLRLLYSPPRQSLVYVPARGFVIARLSTGCTSTRKSIPRHCSREVTREIDRLHANRICIASPPRLVDLRHFKWSGYRIEVSYTYLIDLTRSLDEIWNSFSKDCTKSIGDCEKKRLRLEPSDGVGAFLRVMRRDPGQKDDTFFHRQDSQYLKDVPARFPGNLRMSFLYDDGALVAAAINCEYKKHLLLRMCGKAYSRGDYGEYMNWQFIRQAKGRGCESVENRGTGQKGLCVHKSRFNPALVPC